MNNFRFCLLLCISLLNTFSVFSKKGNINSKLDPFYYQPCRSSFQTVQLQNGEINPQVIESFLKETNENFHDPLSRLRLLYDIESPGGRHFTFEQSYDGIPVFNSQVKVNINKANAVKSVFDHSYFTGFWNLQEIKSALKSLNENSAIELAKSLYPFEIDVVSSRPIIAVMSESPQAFQEIEIASIPKGKHDILLVDENLELKLRRDLNAYFGSSANASALVYIPDPITSAHTSYGGQFVDNDDNDSQALSNERKSVSIEVTLAGNTYFLENNFLRIIDFSPPNIQPAQSPTPVFEFTRSQSGFEEVNAMYHITNYQYYVQSLGFNNLSNFKIDVDAHAMDGDDNSQFIFVPPHHRIYFGTGGIDDAEDADVLIHEYGHSLSYSASPGANSGNERQAIDEGLCDYLAAGYSKDIDAYQWDHIFNWDGNNGNWIGRTVASGKTYPASLTTNIHENGEIWSSALINILNVIGRQAADKILLESLYGLAQNMNMKDAAMLYIQADSALFNGDNYCVIYNAFLSRGLTDAVANSPCSVGISSAKASDAIKFYNTSGFMTGGNLIIEMNDPSPDKTIEVFSINGKLIRKETGVSHNKYLLDGNDFSPGIYVVRVQSAQGERTQKIVRL